MKRVLVISPSGEVYDHDNVRWYNYKDVQRSINHYHNIGDAFVFDSSLKLLNFSKLSALEIVNPKFDDMDRINAEYDFVFLRGSNYVNKDMRWSQTAEVLKRLKIPVIAWGIGAQAPVKGKIELSDETKTVLRLRLWDVATATSLRVYQGHTKEVTSVSFSPDGRLALSGAMTTRYGYGTWLRGRVSGRSRDTP